MPCNTPSTGRPTTGLMIRSYCLVLQRKGAALQEQRCCTHKVPQMDGGGSDTARLAACIVSCLLYLNSASVCCSNTPHAWSN
jgi:hypothetical protein